VAAKIGIYMLDHMQIVDRYVDAVNQGKIILYRRLENIGFEALKSESNFLFFKTSNSLNPLGLKQYLEKNRILIRGPFEKHPFDGHLRITIGDEKQMNYFCDTLENYLIKI
jgi:histidinol-phosphate/aromatic aminotransferase/cobyric acid decarboxylase-like protein